MDKRWGRKQGGVSRYSVQNCLSQSTEKLRSGTFLCFAEFLVSEKIMDKRGRTEGVSRCSVNFFLSHTTEKFRTGTFLFHTNFVVSEYFMQKRWGVKEGGVLRYSVKKLLSQSTEELRWEHFCVSLISGV